MAAVFKRPRVLIWDDPDPRAGGRAPALVRLSIDLLADHVSGSCQLDFMAVWFKHGLLADESCTLLHGVSPSPSVDDTPSVESARASQASGCDHVPRNLPTTHCPDDHLRFGKPR